MLFGVELGLQAGKVHPLRVVADFWEDHCTECGEPVCFRTCPKFRRGAHGRCSRVSVGRDGAVTFDEWGKLELFWHGKLASPGTAARIRAWNARWEPVAEFLQKVLGWLPLPYGRGPYGIFRSLRWRLARRMAEFSGMPARWRMEVSAEKPVSLTLEVRSGELDVLATRTFEAGECARLVEMDLPPVSEGALFSVHPTDGNVRCKVRFAANELVAQEREMVKCVAWDLDGVLWNGTLSEGDDVRLDGDVLDVIKSLDERGIVNSICSKNDEAAAIGKLKELGVEEWFVFPQIGWGPKSESLKRLAEDMNIGLGSIAFVDDREENRGEVKERLPQVKVFAETEVRNLLSLPEFGGGLKPSSGELGRERRLAYRAEMARRRAAAAFCGDAAAFYAASGLSHELLPVDGERKVRCRELVQRTNQLNLTARRYGEDAFDALIASCDSRAVRVWDRYGDYGIVGFVAWRGTHLVECCFSCRVARRGIERAVLDEIADGRRFTADVVATERNAPIRKIVGEWLNA